MNKRIFWVAGLCVAVLAVVFGFWAIKKPAQAMTISPLRLELTADPGSTISAQFKLYNDEDKPETYYFGAANFEAKDETGQPTFTTETGGLADWVQKPSPMTLSPRTYQVIDFSLVIPKSAEPGGYFAAVLASTKAPQTGQAQSVFLSSQVGVLLLLRVNGNVSEGAKILEFDTQNHKHAYTTLPVPFYFRFQNGGQTYLKPIGDIIINNIWGTKVKIINANKDDGAVLPQSIRRYETAWQVAGDPVEQDAAAVAPPRQGGFWNAVKYEWNNFAFGRYTATLNVVFGTDNQQHATTRTSFWVIPWQLLLVEIVTFLAVSAVFLGLAIWIVLAILKRRDRK